MGAARVWNAVGSLMRRRSAWPLAAAALAAVWMTAPARAAETATITVTGSGTTLVAPTQAEISIACAGQAELGNDALVKWRDARRKVDEVVKALKNENITIDDQGPSVGTALDQAQMQAMMQGQAVQPMGKGQLKVSERMRVIIKGIDKLESAKATELMVQVADALRDAGVTLGDHVPSNPWEAQNMNNQPNAGAVIFRVADDAKAKAEATQKAMAAAKARAGELAALADAKVGPVMSISEQSEPFNYPQMMPNGEAAVVGEGPVAVAIAPLQVRVTVMVQFTLVH